MQSTSTHLKQPNFKCTQINVKLLAVVEKSFQKVDSKKCVFARILETHVAGHHSAVHLTPILNKLEQQREQQHIGENLKLIYKMKV